MEEINNFHKQFFNQVSTALETEKSKIKKEREQLQQERQQLEEDKKKWEVQATRLHKSQIGPKIKLDIGGTIFATSLTTLTVIKESYFVSMFSGRWELKPQEDGSYFIDRDPLVFRYILNFLRDQQIDVEVLTKAEFKALILEAKFYLLQPLIDLLEPKIDLLEPKIQHQFLPLPSYTLSNNNKCATAASTINGNSSVFGNIKVSSGLHSWTIKILKITTSIMIGVVPSNANNNTVLYNTNGWYLDAYDSTLYCGPPLSYGTKKYSNTGRLVNGSTVTVKLNVDNKTITYIINGTDYGVAYNNITSNTEMSLCVSIWNGDDSVEIVS